MTITLPPRTWQLIADAAPGAYEHIQPHSVHVAMCSPPFYAKRDYDPNDPDWLQLGQEDEPEQYITNLVACLDPIRKLLHRNGSLIVNIGDTYAGSGGSGGDYNSGGLREGQPGYEGTGAKARRGTAVPDPRLGHDRIEGGVTGRRGHGAGGYANHKPKDLIGIPWMLAQAMKAAGWYWRSDIIWAKPNPMPEGPGDRPAGSHEYVWLFTPTATTWWDHFAVQEPARPKRIKRPGKSTLKLTAPKRLRRSVWSIQVSGGYRSKAIGAHHATYPEDLAALAIMATTSEIGVCSECGAQPRRLTHRGPEDKQLYHDGWELPECGHEWKPTGATVLDPFNGAATTALAALRRGRSYIGIEPVATNIALSVERIQAKLPLMASRGDVLHPPQARTA